MKKEYLLAAYTILCWGTLPAVTKLAFADVSNMQVLFVSSSIAAICLFLYLGMHGKMQYWKRIQGKDLFYLAALGFLGNFLYSAFYYASLRLLPSADACVLNYLWPMVATVYATFALREKIGGAGWLALLMSFIGVIMIATKGRGFHIQNGQGVLLCVAGAVCYGVFNVCNKKKGLDQYFCTTVYFAVTAICSGILFGLTEKFTPMSMKAWTGMIWLGVFIDALAILAWGLALQKTDIGFLSNFAYMTPVAAMVISFVLLGERMEFYSILGMLFIIGGCFLRMLAKGEKNHLIQRKEKQRIR